jgi:hypothetical protein
VIYNSFSVILNEVKDLSEHYLFKKKGRGCGPALLYPFKRLGRYLPVRASEWTQPCMRDLAF